MNLRRLFDIGQWQPSRRRTLAEIDEEFQFHLEQRARDSEAEGMDPAEARRDAERGFGDTRRYREQGEKVLRGHGRKLARASLVDGAHAGAGHRGQCRHVRRDQDGRLESPSL